jgi:DNA-directed RNA polymerase specialized sigma24 family protein
MNNTQILRNTTFYSDSINQTTLNLTYKVNAQQLGISSSRETLIPLNILKHNSSLEAIVFYLKDVLNLKFNEIADLLNRDQRTIWVTYANAKKKKIVLNVNENAQFSLPINMFVSRTFSILETIVFYLRTNNDLSFNQISELLGKNYRTVWTVYRRALKKLEHEK